MQIYDGKPSRSQSKDPQSVLHNACRQCHNLPHLFFFFILTRQQILRATITAATTTLATGMTIMMSTLLFGVSSVSCVVGVVDEAVVVTVDDAVVVSEKRSCTFEMLALMADEMSATDDLTIATKTFLETTAIDDPGGD